MAYCVHHVPGRARIKVPQLRSDPALSQAIQQDVVRLEGIRHVEVNRHAACLVIHYDAEVNALDTVLDRIRAHMPGRTDGVAAAADRGTNGHAHTNGHGPSGDMVRAAGQVFGQAVFATLVQRTLERSLLSLLTGIR